MCVIYIYIYTLFIPTKARGTQGPHRREDRTRLHIHEAQARACCRQVSSLTRLADVWGSVVPRRATEPGHITKKITGGLNITQLLGIQ